MTNNTTTTNQESTTKNAQEFLTALEGALVETLEDKGYSEEEVQEYLSDEEEGLNDENLMDGWHVVGQEPETHVSEDELEALMFGDDEEE